MNVRTGVDIIDLKLIHDTLEDPKQLQRLLHPSDLQRNTSEHIAGRIALKEATIKALGLNPGEWLNIYVHTEASGKPTLSILNPPSGLQSIDGSISHHGDMVIGFVVALFDDFDDKES